MEGMEVKHSKAFLLPALLPEVFHLQPVESSSDHLLCAEI